jgi:hypothetical protein
LFLQCNCQNNLWAGDLWAQITKEGLAMSLEAVTAGLKEKIGEDCGLGSVLKFDFGDDGILLLGCSSGAQSD